MSKPTTNYQLPTTGNPKVALVADWIYGGGSERVVEQLHKLYPKAPIYTSYCSDEWRQKLDDKVITGYLQHPPFRQLRKFLPLLRQWWFARLDLSDFDIVISCTGNGEAKFARPPQVSNIKYQISDAKRPIHISYCYTPVHYYWRHYETYLQSPGFKPAWLARLGLKLLVSPLRKRDYQAAQKVDQFIAISSHIQNDIKQYYNCDSVVIYPPVGTKRFSQVSNIKPQISKPRSGFVTMGRQVPLKRTELLIQVCNDLSAPLTIIGRGPEHDSLVAIAGPTVKFKTDVTDEQMPAELAGAEAFLFASFEDFGIAPIEAMAAGTPVIAYKAGGALDYVIPGKTGEFFAEQTVESLTKVLKNFDASRYDSNNIAALSQKFSAENFRSRLPKYINSLTK